MLYAVRVYGLALCWDLPIYLSRDALLRVCLPPAYDGPFL